MASSGMMTSGSPIRQRAVSRSADAARHPSSRPHRHRLRSSNRAGLQELPPFELERYFAEWEFSAPHLLCPSDTESLAMSDLLALADEDVLQRWERLALGYTQTQGLPELRQALAAVHYTSLQERHLVLCAPQEGVTLAMLALLRPGDHVVVQYPGYQSLYQLAASMGCHVARWEPSSGAGKPAFEVGGLLRVLRHDTRLVVVNAPHNPTGWLPGLAEWREITEACRSRGAWLFSDEMYRWLEFDPGSRLPSAADEYPERGVALCGMSKSVGLPGLRLGWLAARDASFLARVLELKDYTTICSSAPSEVLGLAAARAWPALVSRQLATVSPNLGLLREFFARHDTMLAWSEPAAGTVAFPRLLTGEPVASFCGRLVREAGVLLLPATVYGHEPSIEQGRFRLGFGRRSMPAALGALDAWLAEQAAS